jgi:glycine/D-amino acid oxidase-like deaminating enzyme
LNAVSKEPEAYHRLNADGLAEYAGLAEELGVEIGLHGGGSLQWGDSDDSRARLRERTDRLAARGYPAEWISRAEALRIEPGLAIGESVEGVAYHPGDGWVDAPRLARAFVNRALADGADLWRGVRVRSLRSDVDRATGVDTDRGEVRAGHVLLCAGTGTAALLAPLGVRMPVRPVPGLLAVTSPITEPLGRVVYAPGVHLRPDVDGGLRIGADDIDDLTSEITAADPPPAFAEPLLERAKAVYPPARDAQIVRVHIGVRPVPEDGLTVAGPVSGVANAWVIVTHSGITMGPLLGRLIAEEMTGGPIDPRLASFRPERFAASH